MTRIKGLRLVSVLMVAALLAGCSGGDNTVITIINPTPLPAANDLSGIEGFYAPDNESEYVTDEIIPGQLSESEWFDQGDRSSELVTDYSTVDMERGDFTYGVVVADDAQISPFRTTYRDFYAVNRLVFESLVELDANMQPTAMLAEDWSYEGNEEWVFTLRSGVQFHNGQPLTAEDVVASFNEIKNNPATVWYELSQYITTMVAEDTNVVRVKSSGAGYMVLYAMTFPIAHRDTVSIDWPMGTGPYWYIRYDQGTSLRLESNPFWWKKASGAIGSVVVLCYKTIKAAMVGLEVGEIDGLATDYPTASLSRSLTDRITRDYSTQTYECIVPNLRGTILSDLSVRQALMYAIDRTTLGNTIYAGMVQESEVPVVPGSWLYNPQATKFNYSPERALQLLYDAGWADIDGDGILEKNINGEMQRLSLTIITYDRGTTATRSEAIEEIARELKLVGFEIITETRSMSKVLDAIDKGNFQLALVGYELSQLPNLAFLFASSSKNSSNYARYESNAMDGYLHDAYFATDQEDLKAAMANVQMQIVDDLPVLGLFFRAGVMISRESVGGLSGNHQYDVLRGLARITPAK